MTGALRRLWHSLGFRLSVHHGVLMAITLLTTLSIVHLQTVGLMTQALERQVRLHTQQLMARHAEGGLDAVAAEIQRALRDGIDSGVEVYLLLDAEGRRLAGNVDAQAPPDGAGVLQAGRQAMQRDGRDLTVYLQWQPLPGGAWLAVGQDLHELGLLQDLIRRASLAAGMVAVLLIIGSTFVTRVAVERSIGALRRTAARITAGDLRERVALSGDEEEFDLLKQDINRMLDRIQQLMDGVRNVSDSMAHNLRTPLTRTLMRLEAARDGQLAPARQAAEIAAAIDDLQDLSRTCQKLLQIAESESGARRRRFHPVALHALADDVVELYQPLAEEQGLQVLREPAEPAVAHGDRDLLAAALANLLDNAIKHAGRGATVRVGTTALEAGLQATVQDDGRGVAADELPRLGSRFHRLNAQAPGHGLGLASVRATVVLHGGQLHFEDAAPGLRVRLLLPTPDAPPNLSEWQ